MIRGRWRVDVLDKEEYRYPNLNQQTTKSLKNLASNDMVKCIRCQKWTQMQSYKFSN